jgi:hypothetical protein
MRPYPVPVGNGQDRSLRNCTNFHRFPVQITIARHGRRPGSRTVISKANTARRLRRMGFQREGQLCAKPFPLACLSSDSFRTSGKNRPPEGWTSRRIPPGHPGRPAAPAQANDAVSRGRIISAPTEHRIGACKLAERSRPFPTVRREFPHPPQNSAPPPPRKKSPPREASRDGELTKFDSESTAPSTKSPAAARSAGGRRSPPACPPRRACRRP